ncbi:MAG: hypothetical protein R3F56_19440 [Planctomycetota bacterium]
MNGAAFAAAGVAVGALQATLLAGAVRRPTASGFWLRLGVTGVVLWCAARTGHLWFAAGGWALGFAVACGVTVAGHLRRDRQPFGLGRPGR